VVRSTTKFAYVPAQQESLVYRLVGFFEYSQALRQFDKFVADATSKELEIADEIIREQPQFIVHTNLSSRIEKPGSLSEQDSKEVEQHGLAWMMSLARIEVGAMLAGFTSIPKPFGALPPTNLEVEQYRELVTDGLRTHYWALRKDRRVIKYWQSGYESIKYAAMTPTGLIAYIRRSGVALQFLNTTRLHLPSDSTQAQRTELDAWQQELDSFQHRLLYCLSQQVGIDVAEEYTGHSCGRIGNIAAKRIAFERTVQSQRDRKLRKSIHALENPYLKRDPSLFIFDCTSPRKYDDYSQSRSRSGSQ
jgi:hypothetical protein